MNIINKRTLTGILAVTTAVAMHASSIYDCMVFELNDGRAEGIALSDLSLSFDGEFMSVSNADENLKLPLVELKSMAFSNYTGVNSVTASFDGEVEVYALSGVKVGKFDSVSEARSSLDEGVYILKNREKRVKVKL